MTAGTVSGLSLVAERYVQLTFAAQRILAWRRGDHAVIPGDSPLGPAGRLHGHRSQPHTAARPGLVEHRVRRRRAVGGHWYAQGRGRDLFDLADHLVADLSASALRDEHAFGDLAIAGSLASGAGLFAHR
ncbi:hypothetical protein D3C76_1169150 [compost metagenome]